MLSESSEPELELSSVLSSVAASESVSEISSDSSDSSEMVSDSPKASKNFFSIFVRFKGRLPGDLDARASVWFRFLILTEVMVTGGVPRSGLGGAILGFGGNQFFLVELG